MMPFQAMRFRGVGGGSIGPDPLWSNVEILLPMTGAEGSTTFADINPNTARTWAPTSASIDADAYPGGAGDFTSVSSRLVTPDHASLDLHSAEWCIESFIKTGATTSDWQVISSKDYISGSRYWSHAFAIVANRRLRLALAPAISTQPPQIIESANDVIPLNSLVHVAAQRAIRGGVVKFEGFVGTPGGAGTRVFQVNASTDFPMGNANGNFVVGCLPQDAISFSLRALMRGYRMTKGALRYADASGYTAPSDFPTGGP